MKRSRLFVPLFLALAFTACGEIKTGIDADALRGMDRTQAEDMLTKAGFSTFDVTGYVRAMADTSVTDGEIIDVRIDGDPDFKGTTPFKKEAQVSFTVYERPADTRSWKTAESFFKPDINPARCRLEIPDYWEKESEDSEKAVYAVEGGYAKLTLTNVKTEGVPEETSAGSDKSLFILRVENDGFEDFKYLDSETIESKSGNMLLLHYIYESEGLWGEGFDCIIPSAGEKTGVISLRQADDTVFNYAEGFRNICKGIEPFSDKIVIGGLEYKIPDGLVTLENNSKAIEEMIKQTNSASLDELLKDAGPLESAMLVPEDYNGKNAPDEFMLFMVFEENIFGEVTHTDLAYNSSLIKILLAGQMPEGMEFTMVQSMPGFLMFQNDEDVVGGMFMGLTTSNETFFAIYSNEDKTVGEKRFREFLKSAKVK